MPYGVVGSFTGAVMPYLARTAGIEVEEISWFVVLLFVPTFAQFLYAPVIDFGPKRKHWLLILTVLGSTSLFAAFQMSLPDHKVPFLVFAFAAQMISGLVGSCNGGLLAATIPDDKRGRAGAWYNVGNLCGGGLSAWVGIYLIGHHYASTVVALALAAMMIVPALAVLYIDEPLRAATGSVLEVLRSTLAEVRTILFSRAGATGILLCLSPVGTVALGNYFSAIAVDYVTPGLAGHLATLDPVAAKAYLDVRVSDLLALVNGPLGQVLTAVGALIGGYICDRTNRRAMYLLSGVLTAICAIVMAVSPRTETTFLWGVLMYLVITGFSYAAFTAFVLETIGSGAKAAATQYAMFIAAANGAIAYVGKIDAHFHKAHGVEGVVTSDAALNLGGVIVLGIVFWLLGSFGKSKHRPVTAEA
jgi:MFS family permease